MLRGTGVSEGCGIGKALIIQHRSLDYSGVVFGGAQQEKERLRAAINAFMQKTEQLRDRLQASAGEKEAAILDGHMEDAAGSVYALPNGGDDRRRRHGGSGG